jgi:hypothetical protein
VTTLREVHGDKAGEHQPHHRMDRVVDVEELQGRERPCKGCKEA